MIISASLGFDYVTKYEFKDNVLRGRCQDANISVKLVFDYQSKWILSKLRAMKTDRVTIWKRLVDMNWK